MHVVMHNNHAEYNNAKIQCFVVAFDVSRKRNVSPFNYCLKVPVTAAS